jgi:polyisoprenoid-binding protein YceI
LSALPKVQVSLPVSEMHNDKKSPTMDERMNKELKSADHPRITYRLTEMKPGKAEGGKVGFDTKGELVVAGVTNAISMPVTFEKQPDNKLKVSGAVEMKISDFKIIPPAFTIPIIGDAMKTKDEIKVSFEWVTALRTAQPAK